MPSRSQSLIAVLLLWAIVYLPALGSLAIKGEEGRRILPAISMLESGNYLVPEVGGEAYFRKPPLINWLVAASFKILRARNEWTARLPSTLLVLAVAVAFVTVARTNLGPRGSVIAATIWLTNIGIIEKGRLIEIEALYVSLVALALILWLSFWRQKRSAWLIWLPASIFLGLGWLTKGPVHLLFFYGVVLAVVWKSRDWRAILHPAHLVGIILMLGIFAAWAIPFAHTAGSTTAAAKWTNQFTGRLKGADFEFARWIWNIPHGVIYLAPWVIFLPLIRFDIFPEGEDRQFARGLAWGAVIPFVLVSLVPGSIPRYSMPALIPAIWLLGMTLSQENLRWPRWSGAWIGFLVGAGIGIGIGVGGVLKTGIGTAIAIATVAGVVVGLAVGVWTWNRLGGRPLLTQQRRRVVFGVTGLVCVCMAIYAVAIVPKMYRRQRVKRLAQQIDETVPRSETVFALDPNYQPIFFYLKSKLAYATEVADIPLEATYLLVRPQREQEVMESHRWAPRQPHRVLRMTDYRKETILLLKIE